MNKDILIAIDTICDEKSLDREAVISAIESALASAIRKKFEPNSNIRIEMDRQTGECTSFRRWLVMDDEDPAFESPVQQILLSYARAQKPDIQVGEYIEQPLKDQVSLGRISAHTARQVIMQKMFEAENERVIKMYEDKTGSLVMGIVKRDEPMGVHVDLGNSAEGFIPREHTILKESFRPRDRVRAYLQFVNKERRSPQLVLSRTAPEFLIELFRLEVPEVGQGIVDIMSAARDPGLRAKIAVRSNDVRFDPVGACVGMRGSRVQTVSNELAGERVDIVLWDENPVQYVINALAPASVLSVVADEEKKSMDITVEEDKLAQVIGRNGQNVRLACQLTGWKLEVLSTREAEEKSEKEQQSIQKYFQKHIDVDERVAAILVDEGYMNLEEVAYAPAEELLKIEEFDAPMVDELRRRSSDALLSMALSGDDDKTESKKDAQGRKELLAMEAMDDELAQRLTTLDIYTMEDLANQSVDDLMSIQGMDRHRAADLIMTARAPWFADDEQEDEDDKQEAKQ